MTDKSTIPTQLETSRLLLRAFRPGDGGWYYQAGLRNRDHLERYEHDNFARFFQNEAEAENAARGLAEDYARGNCYFMAALEKDSAEFVAQVYIGVPNRELPEYEVGYWCDLDHEGRGYVSEAVRAALQLIFEHLGGYRARLECDDTNTRSSRVAERCGFRLEAHFRENKLQSDGTITGTLVYGLLRSDYELAQAGSAGA